MEDFHISLRSAIDTGRVDIVKTILDELHAKGLHGYLNDRYKGTTLLHYATKSGSLDSVRTLLVAFNADSSLRDLQDTTCYHLSQSNPSISEVYHMYLVQLITGNQVQLAEKCFAAGMSPNLQYPKDGSYLIHWACHYSNVDTVEQLVKLGSDVNVYDAEGVTCLHVAAKNGNENLIKLLLQNSADPNAKALSGKYFDMTAMDVCKMTHPQLLHLFSSISADIATEFLEQSTEKFVLHNGTAKTGTETNSVSEIQESPRSAKKVSINSIEKIATLSINGDKSTQKSPVPWVFPTASCARVIETTENPGEVSVGLQECNHVVVYPQNFPAWQNLLDMLSMLFAPLGRIGKTFTVAIPESHDSEILEDGPKKKVFHLNVCLLNSRSSSVSGKYTLSVNYSTGSLKAPSLEGIRNGLASFQQCLMSRENVETHYVLNDTPVLDIRAVLIDSVNVVFYKIGVLYETFISLSLLKFNYLFIPLSVAIVASRNVIKVAEKLVDIHVLAERFCFNLVPYLELSSLALDPIDLQAEMNSMLTLIKCFRDKTFVAFGPNFSSYAFQDEKRARNVLFFFGISQESDLILYPGVGFDFSSLRSNNIVCVDNEMQLSEAFEEGCRILSSHPLSCKHVLASDVQSSSMGREFRDTGMLEGHIAHLTFASEALAISLTFIQELISNSHFAWTGKPLAASASGTDTASGSVASLDKTVDKLLFNQIGGFGVSLRRVCEVERELVGSGVGADSVSPVLRWLEDPGLLGVDLVDRHQIALAEKELREVSLFIDSHHGPTQPAQISLAAQSQGYLTQLRACNNVLLFTVKLLKSLYFAGKNPAGNVKDGITLASVNLGVNNLSRTVKSDLANRLIVVINDLSAIATHEMDEGFQPNFQAMKSLLEVLMPSAVV